MDPYRLGSVSNLQKKRRGSRDRSQTSPRPPQTVGNPSYIFFLSHLCCTGPHNSIGARRYIIFLASTSKSPNPIHIRSHLRSLPKPENIQISQTSQRCFSRFWHCSEGIFMQVLDFLYRFRLLVSIRPPLQDFGPLH